jgi:hypothetical protein
MESLLANAIDYRANDDHVGDTTSVPMLLRSELRLDESSPANARVGGLGRALG